MYERVANSNKKLEDIIFVSGQNGASSAKKHGGTMIYQIRQSIISRRNGDIELLKDVSYPLPKIKRSKRFRLLLSTGLQRAMTTYQIPVVRYMVRKQRGQSLHIVPPVAM